MNRGRMLFGFAVALIVALFASIYVYRHLPRSQGAAAKPIQPSQVVVTNAPVKMGDPLTAAELGLMDWPAGKVPPGALTRVEDAVGRAAITPFVQGEVVLDQELAKKDAGSGLPVTIPDGMRAVSVGVDQVVAVAGFVTPGTLVDVLVTGVGQAGPVTRTILEHVRVIAVGQEVQSGNGKPQMAPVVTVLVSPEDSEKLTLASAEGKLHLALRNTSDVDDTKPAPVYASSVFTGAAPVTSSAPVVIVSKPAPPPQPFTVQVIRGDRVETQTFPK
jgi:pilus assembly protein CpaB